MLDRPNVLRRSAGGQVRGAAVPRHRLVPGAAVQHPAVEGAEPDRAADRAVVCRAWFCGLPTRGSPRCRTSPTSRRTLRSAACGWRTCRPGPADGPVALLLHGEPTWSFLYRKVMPVLADAGIRAVAPDLIGFGRSDKPAAAAHTYAAHVEWVRALAFDALDLRDVTVVGQDWGGLIGLRLAAEHPSRVARIVAANTGLPTGEHGMPDVWWQFRRAVEKRAGAGHRPLRAGRLPDPRCPTRCAPPTTRRSRTSRTRSRRGSCRAWCRCRSRTRRRRRTSRRGRCCGRGTSRSCRVQRRRPDHRPDGAAAAVGHPGRRGPRPPDDRGRGPLPAGGRGRAARRGDREVHACRT